MGCKYILRRKIFCWLDGEGYFSLSVEYAVCALCQVCESNTVIFEFPNDLIAVQQDSSIALDGLIDRLIDRECLRTVQNYALHLELYT